MTGSVDWPPTVVQLPEWDNGGGVAVQCSGAQHRVVRHGDNVIALDHLDIEREVSGACAALLSGDLKLLGYRFVDTGFLIEDLERWRKGRTWTSIRMRLPDPIEDPSGLSPCTRLVIEGFVPCMWCGNLLSEGSTCLPSDCETCALSSGNGWKKAIPAGWVQGTQIGSPHGLSTVGWSERYRWVRNGPFTHHRQVFLASPWWPEVHPRRLKNLVCQYGADHKVPTNKAFKAVATELRQRLGEMKPPPPVTHF